MDQCRQDADAAAPSNEISSVVRGSADDDETWFGLIEFPFCRAAQALLGSGEGGRQGGSETRLTSI